MDSDRRWADLSRNACGVWKMRRRSESGWKRASAALVLLVWIGALLLCSAECLWARRHSHSEGSRDYHTDSHSAAALLGVISARAHEKHEHPPGPGLFGHPPEHVHVLLNPMPVYGLMIGALALTAGLLTRSRAAQVLAVSIVVVAAASAWPVQYFGENAYQEVRKISDEQGQYWLDEHMGRAETFVCLFYGTALLGIAALVSQRKFPKAATPLAIVTLIASIASASVGGWISRAGGHIRHPEFRGHSVPSGDAAPHKHGAPEPSI